MQRKTQLSVLTATALLLAPSIALACPVCAADNNPTTLKVVAAFLTVPFIIAFVVFRALRRIEREG
jgi:hypothetical protein